MSVNAVEIAALYMKSLLNHDFSEVPFSDDVTFEGPMVPEIKGKQDVVEFLDEATRIITDMKVNKTITDGEHVVSIIDISVGPIVFPACEVMGISDGKITMIRNYYDPTPLAALGNANPIE